VGDVALTPADEEKAIPPIHILTSNLARNLVTLLRNSKTEVLEAIPDTLHKIYIINFGTQG
jgi:hypothetical protein